MAGGRGGSARGEARRATRLFVDAVDTAAQHAATGDLAADRRLAFTRLDGVLTNTKELEVRDPVRLRECALDCQSREAR